MSNARSIGRASTTGSNGSWPRTPHGGSNGHHRGTWPREESNLRTQLRRLPLYPLSYGAERPKGIPARGSLLCAGWVAVAQLVELRVVVPVLAGSSPVRHPVCFAIARRGRGV